MSSETERITNEVMDRHVARHDEGIGEEPAQETAELRETALSADFTNRGYIDLEQACGFRPV